MSAPDFRAHVRAHLDRITGDPAHDADIVEELAQHLAERHAEHLRRGVDPGTALRHALDELEDPDTLARSLRGAVRHRALAPTPPTTGAPSSMWHDLVQDVRYGTRILLRARGFATAAILTLALGIGATTSIFSVVNTVLLQPVPFRQLDRLVMAWQTDRNTGTVREPASLPDFLDWKARSRAFEGFGGFIAGEATMTPIDGEPSRLPVLQATHDLIPLLGVRPLVGRTFTAAEDVPGAAPLALISEGLWERRFQRAPDVVGRTIRLDDADIEIIGVMPSTADFGMMQVLRSAAYGRGYADRDVRSRVDVWLSLRGDVTDLVRDTHPLLVIGRLAPTASVASGQEELTRIMADLEAQYRSNEARGAFVESMSDVVFASVRRPLWVLLAAVAFVLLIACVNVANLLLARGSTRAREVAVRTAIGAPLARLIRQFAAENLVLSGVGGVLGVGLAALVLRALVVLAPADIPRITDVRIDGMVLAVAAGMAILTGFAFGFVPALQARRLDVQGALKSEESRGATAGHDRGIVRSTLVVSEVALAVVLVIGASLLIKSAWRLSQVDTGFHADGVVKAQVQLPASRYRSGSDQWPNFVAYNRFNDAVLRRLSGLPGVEAVAAVGNHPVDAGFQNSWQVVGREEEGRNWPEISVRRVGPGYFSTVQLPIVNGRGFTEADGSLAPSVVMINETTARRFFATQDPIGQQVRMWGANRAVVGVVRDERIFGLSRDAPPALYLPLAQAPSFDGAEALLVRTSGPTGPLVAAIRNAVTEVDPLLAVFGIQPLQESLAESVAGQRFVMRLLVALALLALLLASIGIHGVLSYAVAQRRHELGIRIALGAPPGRVTALVLRQGMLLTGSGLLVGLGAAFALTRVLASQLYGVSATDRSAFVVVLPVLATVALLATWLPARQAVRADPLAAMRE